MKFKHIHFIINPASGKEEPVLSYINRAFAKSKTQWDISVTKKDRGAGEIARSLIGKTDLVAVYGGDGCVCAVATALHGTALPMMIIPGGTANVMAKELGIPLDTEEALEMLRSNRIRVKLIDMGLANGHPFLLRINLGIMADMVLRADRGLKDTIGQLAYGITALTTVVKTGAISYRLNIDGKKITASGVSLTITNSGSIGIGEFSMLPGISITDGLLDIILLEDNDMVSLLKVAGSTLLQNKSGTLKHWQCRKVTLSLDSTQPFLRDDEGQSAKSLRIEVVPRSLKMIFPVK